MNQPDKDLGETLNDESTKAAKRELLLLDPIDRLDAISYVCRKCGDWLDGVLYCECTVETRKKKRKR